MTDSMVAIIDIQNNCTIIVARGYFSFISLKSTIQTSSCARAKLEDLTEVVSALQNTIESVIPETKELVKNVIIGIMEEQEKAKKPNLNPV
jgi:hypothetical protein